MTSADLVLQFLGTAVNPLVLAAALFATLRLSRAWQVRLTGTVLAGALGGIEGAVLGGAVPALSYAFVSAGAGLVVTEAILHVVPALILFVLRVAARAQAWLRKQGVL
ncbi:hypothetical protein [Indioceanicola profundi]|uniref:hypothetical protein n=1 Tax=Indioceanicola profundi TaxID=2220096 RepID=UPI0013C4F349|nr:hypothetical protein [Indioceanicola profundi]